MSKKTSEAEKLLERIQVFFKEIQWNGPRNNYPTNPTPSGCICCMNSISEGHKDNCFVKEVLGFDTSSEDKAMEEFMNIDERRLQ